MARLTSQEEFCMRTARRFSLCLCAAISWLSLAFGQVTTNQEISGQISDSSGASVQNALVTASNTATGLTRTAHTNESGNYVVANLPIGFYNVSVEAQGFKKYTLNNVEVVVDSK